MEDHNIILESNGDEENDSSKDHNLESTKEKAGEVREENVRLKFLLATLVKDYQSLQTNFFDTFQQDKPTQEATKVTATSTTTIHEESDELVSLSLGVSSSSSSSKCHPMDEKRINSNRIDEEKREDDEDDLDKGLALGLDIKFDPQPQTEATNNPSPESSLVEGGKEEEPTEMWPPSKVLKTSKAVDKSEASHQQPQLKKARVSIRARCDTQTMNDGCQWRKYGQKIAKGNPCPRAYYRCTVSPSCPVRKQVQRCAEDMSILITTYEGTHNHSLPISATAMASTTSAAASMLQSPSLTSQQGLIANSDIAPFINSMTAYNPNALNFSTCQISSPHQFYFPNSSISTSNNPHHPTITLDLTAPPTSSHSGNFSSGFSYTPKYSSTSLNFSSTNFSPLQSSTPQYSLWNNYSGNFNSGTLTQNRNQGAYVINSGSQSQPFQGNLQQPIYRSNHTNISEQPSPDSIAVAAKAITTNPKFQSALATALTTYVGNGGAGGVRVRENHVAEGAALNLKLSGGDMSYSTSGQNDIGCASSRYLFNAQQGNSMIFPPPPPAVSKGSPGSSSNGSNLFLEQWK